MTYVLDPFSASVAGWTLLGKTIEHQLRVGTAVQQAMFASFGFSPLKSPDTAPETVSNFISKRTETASKKVKSVSRKAPAKSKTVTRKVPVAKNAKPSAAPAAVKPAPVSPAKVATSKPVVSKLKAETAVEAKTVPAEKQATAKSEVKAAKVVEKSVPVSKPTNAKAPVQPRRARQPSKPPAMPETPKK